MIIFSEGNVEQLQSLTPLEQEILADKQNSPVNYYYDSPAALEFELKLRSGIVKAAKALNRSGADFATFENSKGNKAYWSRAANGGLQLKSGVLPSNGINDIFQNGHRYAFECATAMVIVVYKAVLDVSGKEVFNANFENLLLYDWHYDSDLNFITTNKNAAYPGDIFYFKNPDHAPDKPEWQGENAILLRNNQFYGHGIGIVSAGEIIAALNKERSPGSDTSAYLTDEVIHPDFEHLRNLSSRSALRAEYRYSSKNSIVARIGNNIYVYNRKSS